MILLIDTCSKYLIIHNMKYHEYKKLFFIINLLYVRNYSIVLNIMTKFYTKHQYIFLILQFILIIHFILRVIQTNTYSYKLMLSGAISNISDHLYHGYIIDFIDINYNDYHIIILNFADLVFFIGIVISFKFNIAEQFKK